MSRRRNYRGPPSVLTPAMPGGGSKIAAMSTAGPAGRSPVEVFRDVYFHAGWSHHLPHSAIAILGPLTVGSTRFSELDLQPSPRDVDQGWESTAWEPLDHYTDEELQVLRAEARSRLGPMNLRTPQASWPMRLGGVQAYRRARPLRSRARRRTGSHAETVARVPRGVWSGPARRPRCSSCAATQQRGTPCQVKCSSCPRSRRRKRMHCAGDDCTRAPLKRSSTCSILTQHSLVRSCEPVSSGLAAPLISMWSQPERESLAFSTLGTSQPQST
jgi:hypothetical protein